MLTQLYFCASRVTLWHTSCWLCTPRRLVIRYWFVKREWPRQYRSPSWPTSELHQARTSQTLNCPKNDIQRRWHCFVAPWQWCLNFSARCFILSLISAGKEGRQTHWINRTETYTACIQVWKVTIIIITLMSAGKTRRYIDYHREKKNDEGKQEVEEDRRRW